MKFTQTNNNAGNVTNTFHSPDAPLIVHFPRGSDDRYVITVLEAMRKTHGSVVAIVGCDDAVETK